ncbi:MAG: family 10 glycosylhydrolase, partial [Acidobacteria bacterium]|nr:family 10 glycosylhydrolase [Acidobacteriota bacterium]
MLNWPRNRREKPPGLRRKARLLGLLLLLSAAAPCPLTAQTSSRNELLPAQAEKRQHNWQPHEPPGIPREFRAAWIATVSNIDFPSRKSLAPDEQKRELLEILTLAERLRLNVLIFQVRPMTDAVYRSSIEPWSEFLTGEMGRGQHFDPLEFLVAEAHKRGILVHAWFNPYRAFHPSAQSVSSNHVSKTKPSIVRRYGRSMWLDPTDPDAKKHSIRVIADVVRRYDVDGVHFDDYFYPYAEKDAAGNKIDFPDEQNWQAYLKRGGKQSRGDWRRSHVDDFVEAVGREVKRIKPEVLYGISPFGIWQPDPSKDIAGFNAYAELYADARKWLQDGTVDYLAPQLYWETARKGLSFPVLLEWWKSQNTRSRHIFPGIAAYRIGS